MASLNNFLNTAGNEYLRLLLIFVLVLIAVFLVFYLIRAVLRMMRGGALGGKRARQPRLGFIEEAEIDARRRLVLIRRDNVEHLILLGPTHDLVVESNIMKAFDAQKLAPTHTSSPMRDMQAPYSEEAFTPNVKNAARKAAGEPQATSHAQAAPQNQAPQGEAPTYVRTAVPMPPPPLQAPTPRATQQAPLVERAAPARFTPIPVAPTPIAAPPARPPELPKQELSKHEQQYEEQIISLTPSLRPSKISFDSLEDEMAMLLGQKKT
jgi:flagellar protein FliO/FliZ